MRLMRSKSVRCRKSLTLSNQQAAFWQARKPGVCELRAFLGRSLAKLIFNFLSLIRHGSSYGSLLAYTPASSGRGFIALVAALTPVLHCFAAVLYCHSKHGTFFSYTPSCFFARSCPCNTLSFSPTTL